MDRLDQLQAERDAYKAERDALTLALRELVPENVVQAVIREARDWLNVRGDNITHAPNAEGGER